MAPSKYYPTHHFSLMRTCASRSTSPPHCIPGQFQDQSMRPIVSPVSRVPSLCASPPEARTQLLPRGVRAGCWRGAGRHDGLPSAPAQAARTMADAITDRRRAGALVNRQARSKQEVERCRSPQGRVTTICECQAAHWSLRGGGGTYLPV